MHEMTLKVSLHFYLLMEKRLGLYFLVCPLYYQKAQCNQKHLFLYFQGDRSGPRKPKNDKHQHLPKSASNDLMIQIQF